MTQPLHLDLNDFNITFKITSTAINNPASIQFFTHFFNRFPHLIEQHHCIQLHDLFFKLYPQSQHLFQLQDNAHKFVHMINHLDFDTIPDKYQPMIKEESILYLHLSARVIFDFIFETTNQDTFLIIDNIITGLNHCFDFDDYLVPWYDYSQNNTNTSHFALDNVHTEPSQQQYCDYFHSLLTDKAHLCYRVSTHLCVDDDLSLQKILATSYFNSIAQEHNMIEYLLKKIHAENQHQHFEIHSFIPINEHYAVNFIIHAKMIDNELLFGKDNHTFNYMIIKALGSYFSKTNQDSNLFIRAINTEVEIMSYNKDMVKENHYLNEIYGFFFNQDFAYGLNKNETKKILEHELYTLKYKKPKPGTFYTEAADLFSQYATDKAISLILGNIPLQQKM